ncbi:MAG: pyridoxamine 5'-phosphate oxidase family protein [Lachnospiraceae bacterium]
MRRTDRERDANFAWTVIDQAAYSVLAMVDREGEPYCIPISPARIGETLYFHSAKSGQKIDELLNHDKVCLTATSKMEPVPGKFTIEFASAVVKGRAKIVTDEGEQIEALRVICQRYTPDNMADFERAISKSLHRTEVIRIDVEEITGKEKKVGT